jgi:hypothetical protein
LYAVSSLGRVRSFDRATYAVDGRVIHCRGRILRPRVLPDGRFRVSMYRDGCGTDFLVHRLVLLAFVGPCPPGQQGCHNDGHPANNLPGNLRWDTGRSNMLDKQRHGTDYQRNKVRCPSGHRLIAPNLVRCARATGHRKCLACSRAHGARQSAVRRGVPVPDFQAVADAYYARICAA